MLDELKFVQGAVSKKDMVPAMSHFCIENGQVRATNGIVTIGSPIACDLNIKPKAAAMVHAIARCEGTLSMNVTAAGKLSIRSPGFRSMVECTSEEYDYPRQEGVAVAVKGDAFREAMVVLKNFVAPRSAPHKWAMGVCLRGQSAMATNGVAFAEYWIGSKFPHDVTIPIDAVSEIIRVKEAPSHLQISETSLTVHYAGGKWIRTALIPEQFTNGVSAIFDKSLGAYVTIPEDMFETARKLKPFMDESESIIIDQTGFRTHFDTNEGAQVDFKWSPTLIKLRLTDLLSIEGIANRMEINSFDSKAPCFFKGTVVRGAIMGMNPHL